MKGHEMAPKVGVQIRPNHVSWDEMAAAWRYADHLGIYPPFTFTAAEVDRVVETIGTVLEEMS